MPWCPCKNSSLINATNYNEDEDDFKKKEISKRLKDLREKDKIVQKKLLELSKVNSKAEKKLAAATKLKKAHKQLLRATTDCTKNKKHNNKYEKSNKKRKTSKRFFRFQKEKGAVNTPHHFLDKIFKFDRKVNKLMKAKSVDLKSICMQILLNPHSCSPLACNTGRRKRLHYIDDCYLLSLRKTPQLWIHDHWPQMYPKYLGARTLCRNCKFLLMFFLGFLFWIPFFICLEIGKCFFCVCCSDCN